MIGVIVLWSGAFAMIKLALEDVTPLDLTLVRFLVAAVPFAVILAVTGLPRFSRAERPRVALIAFLSVAGYHLALNYGETAVSAGVAALIVATGPVWTALASAVWLRERVTLRKGLGIAIALGGVVLLVLGRGEGLTITYLGGALVALAAPAMWAVSSVASKPLLAKHSPLAFTSLATLLGTAPLLAVAATGTVERVASAGTWTWIAFLHLGIGATVLGYVGFNYALRQLSATETMAYVYLNPLFALVWSYFLTGEVPTAFMAAGGALILLGVAATNWPLKQRASPR